MKLKGQNTIELISLVAVVAVVVVTTLYFVNGNSAKQAKLSKINVSGEQSIVVNESDLSVNKNSASVPLKNNAVESAGTIGNILNVKSQKELSNALNKKTLADCLSEYSNQEDIFDLANDLINELKLDVELINKSQLDDKAKSKLVDIAVAANHELSGKENHTYALYSTLLYKIIE